MVKDIANENCGNYSFSLKNNCNKLNDFIDIFNMSLDKYKQFLLYNNDDDLDNYDNEHVKSLNYTLNKVDELDNALTKRINKKKNYLEKKDKELEILKRRFKKVNNNLIKLKNTKSASKPRKDTIVDAMKYDLLKQIFYIGAIVVCGYYTIRFINKYKNRNN